MQSNYRFLISAMTGTVFAALFRYLTFKFPESAIGIGTLGNIKAYLILVILWLGIFFGLELLFENVIKRDMPKGFALVTACIEGSAAVFMSYQFYLVLGNTSNIKHIVGCIIFVLVIILLASLGRGKLISKFFRISKETVLWVETAALAVIWYLASATVNTYEYFSFGRTYNVYHSSAYIDSILNTYYGVPFTGLESELYGHYSVILLPFMKIFGMNTNTIGIILGLLAAASFIMLSACIIMAIESFAVRAAGILALGLYGVTAYSIYWQSSPHRMIFPAIMIFVFTLAAKKKLFGNKIFYIGLVLPVLALVWNTESGAVVVVVWALLGAESILSKLHKLLRFVVSLAISVVASVAGALVILNIYNLSCGGALIGPIELVGFQATGFVGNISKDLASGNALHAHMIAMIFICAVYAVRVLYIKKEMSVKAVFALAVSATGMGMATYYINNPSGGEGILSMYFVLAATIALSGASLKPDPYSIAKTGVAVYAAAAIFCTVVNGRNIISQIQEIRNAGAYDYSKFEEFCADLDSRVAPDTVGGGFGTTAVFMELGRDRVGRDFHFDLEELGYPVHFIKFCDGNDEFEGYVVVDKIFYEDVAFNYYEKVS